jgi:hypothetical protein
MRDYSKIIDRLLERVENREINFDDYVACFLLARPSSMPFTRNRRNYRKKIKK